MKRFTSLTVSLLLTLITAGAQASTTIKEGQFDNINKQAVTSDEQRARLSRVAGLVANYEIMAKKLVGSLDESDLQVNVVNEQAEQLLQLSTEVIASARFRLPQCDEYLAKTLKLQQLLGSISHESLEQDYHHDGVLPQAPAECYHTKDLFVHPATVLVLVRDDPALNDSTRDTIAAEINEVLAHTEVVRELVIY